ncbi:family transcriptional regulator : Transcriptional repressor CopY OS=Sorangium cellulosum (strain So ce56) GN=sce6610 PE=4 SV=1: Penicillinase_R: DDE_Tnp_IS1595 [Gemmata massiliana]|uniref:Uncharacterized protein n=1 Tax=Gemmata massiliana TaxID=1210884 RepID=A0A6P2DKD9_9BACT|nr:BlaI/MecI/CopY family transcriptional regulator [Gemmata massiliana]VTS02813.1 family transcriptional regulator : Transcriptional repressor CopY OS=Sorangium cellulosum (strain So ce56) GN=sce6610 PE=4 SV=1: Penicillinase_R: DDE_Tnp_IS1595 [Gemmata massiliana]
MPELTLESLGPLQRAIMDVLWDTQESTVHEVLRRLSDSKALAYTSVLSTLQKLEKLGWVEHRAHERAYYYRPTMNRAEVGRSSLKRLLAGIFHGNRSRMFQQLLDDDTLTPEELAELQRLIDLKRTHEGG